MKAAAELTVVTPGRVRLPSSATRREAQDRHVIYLGSTADQELLRRHLRQRHVALRVEGIEWRTSHAAQVVCGGNGCRLRPAYVDRARRRRKNRARFRVDRVLVTVRVWWKERQLQLRVTSHRIDYEGPLIRLDRQVLAEGDWAQVRGREDLANYAPAMDAACELLTEDQRFLSYAAGRGRRPRRKRRGRHNAHR